MLAFGILIAVFIVSSGVCSFTGKALWETFKCFGREMYWDIRGRK